MIICVSDQLRGGFVNEVAQRPDFNQEVKFIEPKAHIKDIVDDIALATAQGGCKFIIYDVDAFLDDAEVLINEIMLLRNANGAEPILIVPSLNATNRVVSCATDYNIKRFISSNSTMTDKKSELIRSISGYYDANGREELRQIEKAKEEKALKQSSFQTIGIMGVCHRIGTTTQAIQIVKYLQTKGYKACYVEMNEITYPNLALKRNHKAENSFVEKASIVFKPDFEDTEIGMITLQGVDMFYNQDRLADVLDKNYDFFVYDYGVYSDKGFKKDSYLKDNINLITTGFNIIEADYTFHIIDNQSYKKADMIFSFTPENDREDILSAISATDDTNRCHFADYTPDPFILTNFSLYDNLLQIEAKEGATTNTPNTKNKKVKKEKKEKKSIFNKRR